MAMRANGSAKANRNPHVAKLNVSKTPLALALTVPWNSSALTPSVTAIPVPDRKFKPVKSAEVIRIEEHTIVPAVSVESISDGHVGLDDSVAYESWLEAYSLNPLSAFEIPLGIGTPSTVRSINGKIKTVDPNRPMICWLSDGDTWGDSNRSDEEYPTRTKYRKRNGLSNYHRRKVQLVVNNGPIYKGPSWSSELSAQRPVKGFESWGRPPTCAQLLAEHWNNLARRSDFEYKEVFIQTRIKVAGKKYKDWPIGDCTVINWKLRDASLWGPTLLESTFGNTEQMLVPQHKAIVEDVVEQLGSFEALNIVDSQEYAANDPQDDLSNYGSPIQVRELDVYDETLTLKRIGIRGRAHRHNPLHAKITSRTPYVRYDAERLDHWLYKYKVPQTPVYTQEVRDYRFNKKFYPFVHTNRHTQVLVNFDLTVKTKIVDGVKQEYKVYTRTNTFVGVRPYSASPPVLRRAPAPSQKLPDESRYLLWLKAFASNQRTAVSQVSDSSASDPDLTVSIRISQANWKYLVACGKAKPEVISRVPDHAVYLLPAPGKREPVTFAQEVLSGEIKLRNERRLDRDFEYLSIVGRKDPVMGDGFIGPLKPDPIITVDKSLQPLTAQELIIDPIWTPKVLEQMKGPLVLLAKTAKQDTPPNGDLSKFGSRFVAHGPHSLLLPLTPTSARPRIKPPVAAISPQEFRNLLPDRDPGRQRGTILQKVKSLLRSSSS